jgi:ankyrin repeat protein
MHYMCRIGSVMAVRLLVQKQAELNVLDKHGHTSLMNAALEGHLLIV